MTTPRMVSCPQCGTPVEWTAASKWRPFCSQRCRLVDLGEWAAERYRIAGVEPPDAAESEKPDEPHEN